MTPVIQTQMPVPQGAETSRAAGKWIQALSHLDPRFGGMSVAVPQLSRQLCAQERFEIEIASFSEEDETQCVAREDGLRVEHYPSARASWWLNQKLRHDFGAEVRAADGLHIHGLWEVQSQISASFAKAAGKPYVLSAHGMLEPWALAQRALKKRVYAALIERSNIEGAACLHALTVAEAEDYRRLGSRRPIAVIPNGVQLPRVVDTSIFLEQYPSLRDKRIVLFLGRLHMKKGLDILLDAWRAISLEVKDAVLVLAGPAEDSVKKDLVERCRARGTTDTVVFTGMLDDKMKWSALSAAYCFVLPSYSEGLSVAVLEAMGMGLPVIISDRCHLPEVERSGSGWVIPARLADLSGALTKALEISPASVSEIGTRGRHLARTRFSWPIVAGQMAELYGWIQHGTAPRSFELLEVSR